MKRCFGVFSLIAMLLFASYPVAAQANASIQAQIEPNLSVDAQVTMPELANGQAQAIRVERLMPDADALLRLLSPGASIVARDEHQYGTVLSLQDEASLYTSESLSNFETKRGGTIKQIYLLEPMLNEEALQLPDLAFASREEAIATVEEILSALGAEGARCVAAYALPQAHLNQYSDQMRGRGQNAKDIKAGRIAVKEHWEQADECYLLRFEWAYSSIPVFAKLRESISQSEIGNYFRGSSLTVLISADGIELFQGEDMLREIAREEGQALLSADQVVGLIQDRYRNLIVDVPTTVREIALMYVIRRAPNQEDALTLIPAWCCQVVEQYGGDQPYEDQEWIAFDARSGEQLF